MLVALVCLVVLTEVVRSAPEADPNAEADPFFFGGFGRRGYGGYGGYGRGWGREGGYGRGWGWGR
jgi:hypothetical protein